MTQVHPLPLIDTHQHLWDLDQFRPPWLRGKGPPLERSYGPEAYRAATLGLGVVKAVYMEIDVSPFDQAAEAEQVIALIRRPEPPTVALHASLPRLIRKAARWARNGPSQRSPMAEVTSGPR